MSSRSSIKNNAKHNIGFSADDESLYGHELSRPVFTEKYLESHFKFNSYHGENILKELFNYIKINYKPTVNNFKAYLYKRIPPIEWIPKYDIKHNLIKDLIGGLTVNIICKHTIFYNLKLIHCFKVGIIQVPQCMAYSLAAGLPAYNGLYVTFFQCLLYFLFGTSRHISPGTYAIISLMVYTQTNKYEGILFPKSSENGTSSGTYNQTNSEFISNDPVVARVMISTVLSMSSGILLVIYKF